MTGIPPVPPQPGDLITVCHTSVKFWLPPYRFVCVRPDGNYDAQQLNAGPNDFIVVHARYGTGFGEWQYYTEAVAV